MAAQERLEDADRRPVGLGQFGWLAHQPAVESQRFDAARFERFLDARVERFGAAFVATGPEDAAGLHRGGKCEDRLLGVAFDDVEPRAASGKLALQRRQRLGEPPFRCAAQRARPAACIVMDMDEERRTVRGGMNRRLVIKAEIVTQPDDVDAFAQRSHPRRCVQPLA